MAGSGSRLDGRRLALTATESGVSSILVYDAQKDETTRVTTQPGDYSGLTWLPNGDALVFGGAAGLGWVHSDRPGAATPLANARTAQTPWSVAPGGGRLAYYERNLDTGFDLWTAAIVASDDGLKLGTPDPYLRTPAFEVYPSFSPDGRWITYASNESGAWEIYVRRFPDNGTKMRISSSGGVVPRWSPNGRELLYRTDAQRLMVAHYKAAGDSFVADTPRSWSPHSLADTGVLPNFDVGPDGERILALMPAARPEEQQSANHVTFMLNFSDEVHRRTTSR
jgi:Tol biopolymer transport system component